MTTATAPKLAPETTPAVEPTRRGFPGLRCILCGNADGVISLDLDDVGTFHCAECGEDYSAEDVREHLAAYSRVLAWIDLAPAVEE